MPPIFFILLLSTALLFYILFTYIGHWGGVPAAGSPRGPMVVQSSLAEVSATAVPSPRPVRLLLLIDSIAGDAGTEKQAIELIQRIDKTHFEVHLGCLEQSPQLGEFRTVCKTALFPVLSVYRPRGIYQIFRLRRYLKAHRIEILHCFMQKANIVAVLAARGTRVRAVIASRRDLGYWLTPFYLRLFRYLNRSTTRLLANSEGARQVAISVEGAPPGKVDVLYNGVDITRYAQGAAGSGTAAALGIPPGAPVVGIVANLRPVKDHALFLRAAACVAARVPEAVFLLIGQGSLRESLAQLAGELGIAAKVFFTDGRFPVPDCLALLSIGCLSSESEGFSNAILEYMAAGLPVVATDVGGNAEAIEDGVTGYVVRTRAAEAFAAPLIALLTDPAHRIAMGVRALERCRRMFAIEDAIRRQERYYLALLPEASVRLTSRSDIPL